MGAWSKYPDGNDSNIDIFAHFITRYFNWQDNPETDFSYQNEDKFDPGLNNRMGLRMGASPSPQPEDLSDSAMDFYLKMLQMYQQNIGSYQTIGLAISGARMLNNQRFGIFEETAKVLPQKNVLRKDINQFVLGLIQEEKEEGSEIWDKMEEFFNRDTEEPNSPENDSDDDHYVYSLEDSGEDDSDD